MLTGYHVSESVELLIVFVLIIACLAALVFIQNWYEGKEGPHS